MTPPQAIEDQLAAVLIKQLHQQARGRRFAAAGLPTTPSVSPFITVKLTSSTACTTSRLLRHRHENTSTDD
jgi:hypothetical protein